MRWSPQERGIQTVGLLVMLAVVGAAVGLMSDVVGGLFIDKGTHSGGKVPVLGSATKPGKVEGPSGTSAVTVPEALITPVNLTVQSTQPASKTNLDTPRIRELTARWGVRPRVYSGLWKGDNEAERRFLAALPEVTRFLNERLARSGSSVRVTEAEIATNFLAEGAILGLSRGDAGPYHSFAELGLDSLLTNHEALKPWLHESVEREIALGARGVTQNEKKEHLEILHFLGLEPGLYASGAMYTWSKLQAARDLTARGVDMSALPPEGQFYWGTVYFNSGPSLGRRTLDQYGADDYKVPWSGGESYRWHSNPRYNAHWRTSSFELLRSDVYSRRKP